MTTILIVDDDPIARAVLCQALEDPGRTLVPTGTIAEGRDRAASLDEIDLVLVDKNLPDGNGIELVRELKERHPDAAFVMVTGYPTVDSAAEAVRLGLSDYLSKPFEIDELEAVVKRSLEKVRRARHEAERRKTVEERLTHLALFDPLTGQLNRGAFVDRIDAALVRAKANPTHGCAVIVVGLDGFAELNESIGHQAGDEVLVQWATRLSELVRAGDALARLGGDQLAVLSDGVTQDQAMDVAARIQASTALPFEVGGRGVTLSAGLGVALSTSGYERGEDLLRDAGTALANAKNKGRARQAVFVGEMRDRAVDGFALEQGLRRAVDRGEFLAYYQPIVAVESRRVVGFEALARWMHPVRGLLAPSQFLSRASETGFLAEISWQVLREACLQQRRWVERFGEGPQITINANVAPPLLNRAGFVDDVRALMEELSFSPQHLKIEVTEIVAMANNGASAEVIQSLRRLGLVVCLDDFGTGYASLSWLHQFPVDELKIDRSFVEAIPTDRRSQILVGAAISLAHSLGLPVVAEGVETEEQLAELKTLDCEYAQGYLFAPPLATEDAEALLVRELAAP